MVEIIPFRGLIFNKEIIDKLDDVMSPPYDIISNEMLTQLYQKNPYNFVRLILGKINKDDSDHNNRYTRAKKDFDSWQKENILIKSDKPAIYPYKISYNVNNKTKTMSGFFVLLKLDPEYKKVKAHERTLSKPKADRLNLIRECKSNLEPIQLLYIDEKDIIRKKIESSLKNPIIDVKGYDGFNHRLWKLEDSEIIKMIQNQLNDEILFIADGHHRYQTALNYAEEVKEKTGDRDVNAPFNYRMVILTNMFDKGLSIFPTHRFIKKSDFDLEKSFDQLKKYFDIEEKNFNSISETSETISKIIMDEIKTNKQHKFAIYCKNKYYILTLKDEEIMDELAGDRSNNWRTIDVSILHKIVLEQIMGINQDNIEDHVKYTRVDEEAIKFVDEGKFDFSVLMNATKIDELKAVADAGEHMPQKSTYFLPKMLSGLVIYKMDF